jgi:Flp pilus assembly protein protease CpaA
MNAQTVLALILGSAAIAGDLRRKVISNRICLAALVGGLVCHTAKHGSIVPGSWLTLMAGR